MAEAINALFAADALTLPTVISEAEKSEVYASVSPFIRALCEDENLSALAMMDLVVGALHNAFPTFFWTGFYRRIGPSMLEVGPSQGTLGCSHIEFGKGVCGTVAATERTRVVEDVHAEPNHIACDSASQSEIVVPVFVNGTLAAVLDVDSTAPAAFSQVDQQALEQICGWVGAALEHRALAGVIAVA